MDETTAAATTIVVEVDQSGVISAISDLQGEVSAYRSEAESRAASLESMIVDVQQWQARQVDSSDSQAVGTLIFLGLVLSLCATYFLFGRHQ